MAGLTNIHAGEPQKIPSISMKISNLPLRPSTLSTLLERGFVTTSEVESSRLNGGIANLANELGCTLSEAASIAREVEDCLRSLASPQNMSHSYQNTHPNGTSTDDSRQTIRSSSQTITAASILANQKLRQTRPIVTFCRSIDDLLGGGIATSEVTEIVGVPGVGKTQIAMQLCVDAQLPIPFGGVAGEAVYVDTEGSFAPERALVMARALVGHVNNSAERRRRASGGGGGGGGGGTGIDVPEWFTPEGVLEGIHVYRVHDEATQTATIMSLPKFLKERKEKGRPVKIVVVDSIAFHYRSTSTDYLSRTRSLTTIAAFLSDLSASHELAVVVINQMTTKIDKKSEGHSEVRHAPALGESWAHATTTRLLLSLAKSNDANKRKCTLVKSPHKAAGVAYYAVVEVGVRDAPRVNSSVGSWKAGENQGDVAQRRNWEDENKRQRITY